MKIVQVAAELAPFVKTGGFGEAVAGLGLGLARRGHDVAYFLPGYRAVLDHPATARAERIHALQVELGPHSLGGELLRTSIGLRQELFIIVRDEFFDRRHCYSRGDVDYDDNDQRFIFFAKAVAQSLRLAGIKADVVHGHDWTSGLLPLAIRAEERRTGSVLAPLTTFTLHNPCFPGLFPAHSFALTNLPDDLWSPDGVEFYGQLGLLKAGLLFADRITTVSPSFARDVLTPEHGCGLDGVLRLRAEGLAGICHGVDEDLWNPRSDDAIAAPFGPEDLSGKDRCREALLARAHLSAGPDVPIFTVVGRLTAQKGAALLADMLPWVRDEDLRLVIVGRGTPSIERRLAAAALADPDHVFLDLEATDAAQHQAIAGSDFLLMPSLTEPCGLTQLYAQKYGTVPVASAVGGLVDTIHDLATDPRSGTGFLVPPDRDGLREGIRRARKLFAQPSDYRGAQRRAMRQDFSWDRAAAAYEALYSAP